MLSKFWNALNYLRLTLSRHWDWPVKVTKVKCNNTFGIPIYGLLLRFTSNICPILALLRDISLPHLNNLEIDLSRSLKSTVIASMDPPIHAFRLMLMFNSNIRPNSAPVRDISFQSLSDLDTDFSRSLWWNVIASIDSPYIISYSLLIKTYALTLIPYHIKGFDIWVILTLIVQGHTRSHLICNLTLHIWFPIDIFSNYMYMSIYMYHRIALIAMQYVFSYLLSLGPIKNRKCI